MKDLTKENRFLDFRTRIQNADSHSDAEEVLEALTPTNIRRLVSEIAIQRGEKTQNACWVYEDSAFYILKDKATADSLLKRKPVGDPIDQWEGVVFREVSGTIEIFKPFRTWNILNLLEEILETGEISI